MEKDEFVISKISHIVENDPYFYELLSIFLQYLTRAKLGPLLQTLPISILDPIS